MESSKPAAAAVTQRSLDFVSSSTNDVGKKVDRVILHLDLDCFYCQVESVRLGIPSTVPLAVQQWTNVIAVNYAARKANIIRHSSYKDCLLKCPEVRFVHVPTYSTLHPGQLKVYKDTGKDDTIVPDRNNCKAALQPYREASIKVFNVIRNTLQKYETSFVMEKASVDEVYLDVSEIVNMQITKQYGIPINRGRLYYDKSHHQDTLNTKESTATTTSLSFSSPPFPKINWKECGKPVIVNEELESACDSFEQYLADLLIFFGCQIAIALRQAVFEQLGYTVSAGIATNKTLAKLASSMHKPDQQTYVRPISVKAWMALVPFQKIRFLGGKLGNKLLKGFGGEQNESEDEEYEGDEEKDKENVDSDHTEDETTAITDLKEINVDAALIKSSDPIMASDLWELTIEDLQRKLGDIDSAKWTFNIIRGIDSTPVNPHLKTKSFMSAKNMAPPLKEWQQLNDWFILLITELASRLAEDYQSNHRWPHTLTIYSKRPFERSKTRTMEFPFDPSQLSSKINELAEICLNTMRMANRESPIFPCRNLTMTASRFKPVAEGSKKRTLTIDAFIKEHSHRENLEPKDVIITAPSEKLEPENKKKKTRDLALFFKPRPKEVVENSDSYTCPKCNSRFDADDTRGIQEHQDYHFALELQNNMHSSVNNHQS